MTPPSGPPTARPHAALVAWGLLAACSLSDAQPTAPTEAAPTQATPTEAAPIQATPTEATATQAAPTGKADGDARKLRTHAVLLGTGTPVPDPLRSGPCVAVVVDDTAYLVDLGPGVVRRTAAGYYTGEPSLDVTRLKYAFITHLHSDHTIGYPDLILSSWVVGRTHPLEVYGPPGLQSMTDHILAAWADDIAIRVAGLEQNDPAGLKVNVHEISAPGEVYRDERVKVDAIGVPHGTWRHAYGYRFESSDRTIVISGDTAYSTDIVKACNGCDVLIHEVYSHAGFSMSGTTSSYHPKFHTSTVELAKLANEAKPKLLVLYHQLYMGATDDILVREIEGLYDGEVVSGADLQAY